MFRFSRRHNPSRPLPGQRAPWTLAGSLFGLAVLSAACVTINVYFPEAAVKDLSQQIEDAVAAEAARAAEPQADDESAAVTAPVQDRRSASQSPGIELANRLVGNVLRWLPATDVYANEPVAAPEISNPAIRKIIESRAARIVELRQLKSSGVVGESNQALLEIRDLAALDLKGRAAAQKLVKAENDDRERMFKEIAAATGTDLAQLPQIQSTYAETLRQNAKAGDWIQNAAGNWSQKG